MSFTNANIGMLLLHDATTLSVRTWEWELVEALFHIEMRNTGRNGPTTRIVRNRSRVENTRGNVCQSSILSRSLNTG